MTDPISQVAPTNSQTWEQKRIEELEREVRLLEQSEFVATRHAADAEAARDQARAQTKSIASFAAVLTEARSKAYAQGLAEADKFRLRLVELERQHQAVIAACDEADKRVRCQMCADTVAGDVSCWQCSNTGRVSGPEYLITSEIRDLLKEQQ